MKKSSQRKSANRQKRRNNAERQSAAAAPARAHPRQGHAGRVASARGGSARSGSGRGARAGGAFTWRLPSFAFSPSGTLSASEVFSNLSLDATWQRLSRTVPGRAIAASIPREDRETLALLLTPFLVLAAAIAMSLGVQLERSVRQIAARPAAPIASPLRGLPRVALAPVRDTAIIAAAEPTRLPARAVDAATSGKIAMVDLPPVAGAAGPAVAPLEVSNEVPARVRSVAAVAVRGAAVTAHSVAPEVVVATSAIEPGVLAAHRAEAIAGRARPADEIAALDPRSLAVIPAQELPAQEQDAAPSPLAGQPGAVADDPRCVLAAAPISPPEGGIPMMPSADHSIGIAGQAQAMQSRADFGRRLAVAALGQLDQFVIYNDAYRRLSYPMGDVPKLYGVCTDVVIRAYRALGVDLQVAVQRSGVGAGDPSIDHRRTETLRRFFARAGKNLPVTSFAEDYEPGDIVTYDRPQNSGSRSHIAVVSDVVSQSGRPMIVHNRGWGPQLEDGLFVDRITGHYRFDGAMPAAAPVIRAAAADTVASRRSAGLRAALPTAGHAAASRPTSRAPAARRHGLRSASAANSGPARSTAQR